MASMVRQLVESEQLARELSGRKPRRFRKPRKQAHPDAIEREYRAELLAQVEQTKALIDALLIPRLGEIEREASTRGDADRADIGFGPIIESIFAAIRAGLDLTGITGLVERIGAKASTFNRTRVTRQMRSVLGVDVFFNEPRLEGLLGDFATQNAALIKSIPEQYLSQVEGIVRRGVRSGRRAADIGEEIEGRFDVTKARARFIARDQVSKINSNLTRDRHQALGLEQYIWRTSRDERVRDTHRRLEGTTQSYDDPPSVGHPGEDFQCRCNFEPIIPGAPPPIRTSPKDIPVPVPRKKKRRAKAKAKPKPKPAPAKRTRKKTPAKPRPPETIVAKEAAVAQARVERLRKEASAVKAEAKAATESLDDLKARIEATKKELARVTAETRRIERRNTRGET